MDIGERTDRFPLVVAAIVCCGLAVLVPVAALLHAHGPGRMWLGFVGGGVASLLLGVGAAWRAYRDPLGASVATRAWMHRGDERDDRVLTRSLAVLGLTAMPLTAVATVVVAIGVDAVATLSVLVWTELMILVATFVVVNRRS